MLTKIVNKIGAFGFVMKMAKSITFLWAICFSFTLSAKIKEINSKTTTVISMTGGVIIFESDDLKIIGKVGVNENSSESKKAVVFISEGAVIYNGDSISNVSIVELEKAKKFTPKAKKRTSNKTIVSKPKYKSQNTLETDVYYTSQKSSEKFSQKLKDRVVVSPCRVQTSAKALASCVSLTTNLLSLSKSQDAIYTNPSVKTHYFSGKYSTRPPTLFQFLK
ncbi:hypothetical protein GCM10010992_27540 [Cloacibacterium rupense]|uniref:Organic solvent tolerance-like N-terminal domain-containing protein n=1 Tax=Cloacibacterium rupense TaxID=517423 RepID=A0ABQ2NLW2_9FLAO|nr:hypothetical protein [Cloacibacterium rupense]GGP06676.1 hypothetical protein GCM10010992_27540 [Cloacibacterium rupense]